MSELLPTQDINEIEYDIDSQTKCKPWGRLLPLKPKLRAVDLILDCYSFGREDNCEFQFFAEMFDINMPFSAISKCHFKINREPSSHGCLVFIDDLSSNGTFVNDKKIGKGKRQPLNNNDEISVAIKACKLFIFSDLISVEKQYPSVVTSKYTISRYLGRGACGEVRLVFGKDSCSKYALKIVAKKSFSFLNRGEELNDRVKSEASILKKLNHPCIIQIFDVIDTPDMLYMILELVEYGELFDRVLKLGRFSESDTKFIFIQILLATKYLHDNGITHRDLKPENILLSGPSNRCLVKVTDFGLSKFVDGNTFLRTFCGTPTYLAPEVLKTAGAGAYTSAIDLWSIGVILYICLAGYPPFTDERTDYDLQEQIVEGHYDFPERFWSNISCEAIHLIRRFLSVNPLDRITIEKALVHPWLNDELIHKELSDLLLSSGYEHPYEWPGKQEQTAVPSSLIANQPTEYPSRSNSGSSGLVSTVENSAEFFARSSDNSNTCLDHQPLFRKRPADEPIPFISKKTVV